jgi:hypothetical protein
VDVYVRNLLARSDADIYSDVVALRGELRLEIRENDPNSCAFSKLGPREK